MIFGCSGFGTLAEQRKFVVFGEWPEAGLGNRLQALVSTFLFALLTKRVLLVDWSAAREAKKHWNGEEVFSMVSLEQLFDAPSFEWQLTAERDRQLLTGLSGGRVGKAGFDGYRGSEALFQCDDYNTAFVDADVVEFKADNFFALTMAMNERYRPTLQQWFGERFEIFQPLARFLLRPEKVREGQRQFANALVSPFNSPLMRFERRTLVPNTPLGCRFVVWAGASCRTRKRRLCGSVRVSSSSSGKRSAIRRKY